MLPDDIKKWTDLSMIEAIGQGIEGVGKTVSHTPTTTAVGKPGLN